MRRFLRTGAFKENRDIFSSAPAAGGKVDDNPSSTSIEGNPSGGIDLNPADLNVEVKGEGIDRKGFNAPFDLTNFQGFSFHIIKIERLGSIRVMLAATAAPNEALSGKM